MRRAFSASLIASPLYRATKSPAFTFSNRYSPSPAFTILDFATSTFLGRLLGLGWYLFVPAARFRHLFVDLLSPTTDFCLGSPTMTVRFVVLLRVRDDTDTRHWGWFCCLGLLAWSLVASGTPRYHHYHYTFFYLSNLVFGSTIE